MAGKRLDQLLVERGLSESREKAQRLIRAGHVSVNGVRREKPGQACAEDASIALKAQARFVSRGGEKLEGAFVHWNMDVAGLVCLDVGASTGGFTDCLLQHGAARVMALDVGRGQLHERLRRDPRVTVIERFNARHLRPEDLPERPAFATIDVSFISLTHILPPVSTVLAEGGRIVALIKPQFEAGRDQVQKGGVVRDPEVRAAVVERIRAFGEASCGLRWEGFCPSPLHGPAGNMEFLSYWMRS